MCPVRSVTYVSGSVLLCIQLFGATADASNPVSDDRFRLSLDGLARPRSFPDRTNAYLACAPSRWNRSPAPIRWLMGKETWYRVGMILIAMLPVLLLALALFYK
jgi:hypothetical protein